MNWKTIAISLKNGDMRNRILAMLGMLLIFRVIAHIPIPLSDPQTLKQILETIYTSAETTQLFSFIDILSGGALANFSIMLIGLGPYINASIIMQLLTRAIPKLETLNKEGEFGRKKINQYTRTLTLPLAIIQSIGAIYLVRQTAANIGGLGDITAGASPIQWALMIASLTGASMMLMWLGELITEKGVGNGISLIITVGILSMLPGAVGNIGGAVIDQSQSVNLLGWSLPIDTSALWFALALLLAVIVLIIFVVKLNEAARRVTVHYAKRIQGNRTYGGVTTVLPVKLIAAGVIPIIFAVAFLSVPSFAGQLMVGAESVRMQEFGASLIQWFQTPSAETFAMGGFQPYIYPLVYFTLVVLFTFFYTNITFNAKEIAENLQKQGGFIEGVRSGKQTEKYLSGILNQLTLFGSVSLGFLALTPIIAQFFVETNIAFEGTSVLILVAVALDTLRKIESRALMVTYDQYSQSDFFYDPVNEADPSSEYTDKGGFVRKLLRRGNSKKKK